jgi:hypothetical protein
VDSAMRFTAWQACEFIHKLAASCATHQTESYRAV